MARRGGRGLWKENKWDVAPVVLTAAEEDLTDQIGREIAEAVLADLMASDAETVAEVAAFLQAA